MRQNWKQLGYGGEDPASVWSDVLPCPASLGPLSGQRHDCLMHVLCPSGPLPRSPGSRPLPAVAVVAPRVASPTLPKLLN